MVVAPDLRDGKPPEEAEYNIHERMYVPYLKTLSDIFSTLRLFGWPAVSEIRRHYSYLCKKRRSGEICIFATTP